MKTRIAVFAISVLLLAGCTPTTSTTPASPDDDSAGGEAVPPCFVGQWDLDLTHYRDDVGSFIDEQGLPIRDLSIDGFQTLSISADGLVTLGTSLSTAGSIGPSGHSQAFDMTTTNLGNGDWTSTDPGSLTISNFSFSEVTVSGDDPNAPRFNGCDFTEVPEVDVTCEGDSLVLIGPGAPYGSHWTRS